MSRFLSERLSRLTPYTPGEQPTDQSYIKLNTNESPFPPSPLVRQRVNDAEIARLNLYPDPRGGALRAAIAKNFGVAEDQIFLANGSDEVLSFSFMAFGDAAHGFAFPDITYDFYKVYAALYGVPYREIPLREDFTLPVDELTAAPEHVVFANPNAPTGLSVSVDAIERILAANPNRLVLVDEAYVDFGGESALPLLKKYDNLLISRTYSKSYAMAGARLGFALGSPDLIADLSRIQYSTNPYNVDRLTLVAGTAAVEDQDYLHDCVTAVAATRQRVTEALRNMGFEVLPSAANFVLARHPEVPGQALYESLKARGILVRHFKKPRIDPFIRVSIGTDEQMNAFCDVVKAILQEKGC
ncbi:MAG: histidinol-phosphate transaminase [Clostridia bacterium]|nr:histidinol-phosphate transaminase [Clostridia bacterium]